MRGQFNGKITDNDRTRVTEWVFEIGEETGQHIHEFDYIVVPMSDGELKIISEDGSETIAKLTKGISYFRNKWTNHNVLNNKRFEYSFIEIELK